MASVEIELDLPPEVELRGYERIEEGHAFEVDWSLPDMVRCEKCRRSQPAHIHWKDAFYVIRDLDVWGQPSFFVYQPPFHKCSRCGRRQELAPPFKRKHVTYTYRFEEQVLRLLIGSTEEEVARRLGISAETVALIVAHWLAAEQAIDPKRRISDVGIDEISLKKGHKLYATILTDLSDPNKPQVLAVAAGRDQAAAEQCLERLSQEQRDQIRTYRSDMSPAYRAAGKAKLKHCTHTIDRFHVAKKLGEIVDGVRKKRPVGTRSGFPRKTARSSVRKCGLSAGVRKI